MKNIKLFKNLTHNLLFIRFYAIVFFLVIYQIAYCQSSANSSGGNAKSNEGSVTYSVGQVFYHNFESSHGKIAEGVQHPYEIFIISGVEETDIELKLSSYPNPTIDLIILEIKGELYKNIFYQLYDITGRLLCQQSVQENLTLIEMLDYKADVYILNVNVDNRTLKSFKIIKTN